ncbi:MAG: hypothetical protein R6W76_07030, partial [Caldilinea sp.]
EKTFNPGANGTVYAIVLLEDNSILVAGEFTEIGGALQRYLARLDSTGALDLSFAPVLNGAVYAMAVQRDGAILIGGAFTEIDGQARGRIARLDASGALDPGFAPDANDTVRALAIGFDDTIVVGGDFTQIGGETHSRLARLAANGALVATSTPAFDDSVYALLALADGRIVVGGAFQQVDSQARRGLVRIGLNGAVETNFAPDPNDAVHALVAQADDKIVAGGAFQTAGSAQRERIARFYEDGSLDADFAPIADESVDGEVIALAIQPDGKIVVGGTFTAFSGQPRLRLARFWPDGRLDATFVPTANNDVRAIAIQPDGKIIVAGGFTQINGQNRPFIARLDADGLLDGSFALFNDNTVLSVLAVALQADGKIVMAIEPKRQSDKRPRLVRLERDGSVDATFRPVLDDGQVVALAIQNDGKIVACGEFAVPLGANDVASNIARINPDGKMDVEYAPFVVRCLTVLLQPDGRLIAGGVMPLPLVRLHVDGSTDGSFSPVLVDGFVFSVALQSDGKVIVVNNYEDGAEERSRILRLDSDGAPDPEFITRIANGTVFGALLQKDGKVLLGGGFTTIDGPSSGAAPRTWLARLSAKTAAQQALRAERNGTTVTWEPAGAFPEFARVAFDYSTDGHAYAPLGAGVWTAHGWQATDVSAPFNQEFFLRARGAFANGGFNASTSRIESIARAFVPGGEIEIVTTVNPPELTPQWIVNVAGNTVLSDTLIGADTTGVRMVGIGAYTVTLSTASGAISDEYASNYNCTIDGQPGSGGEGFVVQSAVAVESPVRCVFASTRRTGTLAVRHVVDPAAPASIWDLSVTGPTAYTATLTGDASTGEQVAFTGVHTIDLTQRGSADYDTTYQCVVGERPIVSGAGAQATLTVEDGKAAVCTFSSVLNAPPNQLFLPIIVL